MTDQDPESERIASLLLDASMRSPLGRWFAKHHDEFARELHRSGRVRWADVVAMLAREYGVVTLPPEWNSEDDEVRRATRRRAARAARKVWGRVRQNLARRGPEPASKSPPVGVLDAESEEAARLRVSRARGNVPPTEFKTARPK